MNAYLQIRSISKRFSGVTVLKNVSVDIAKGEIHVIIGENGAGKSTLMKIVAGMHQPDEGRILIDDREVKLVNVLEGIKHGVSMIHQELLPVPFMTVAENIFLGREPKNRLGILDKKALRVNTQKLFAQIGINIDPRKLMRELSVAQIQLVEIAKAVSFNAEILIMDEPTSSLSEEEIEKLYRLIFQLKAKGIAIVFISHKLNEIFRVADKITVLRDGALIGTKHASELNKNTLIAMMIGRELANVYDKTELALGEPVLEVQNLCKTGLFENINFKLYRNEILGIAGLMGAGRTELVESIFGLRQADCGQILVNGKAVTIKNPSMAQENGIALIPEDRKLLGLNLKASTGNNISICHLKKFTRCGMLNKRLENTEVDNMIRQLGVKVTSRRTPVVSLSGGNQQKVVIAKWLMTDPNILIMDEPTRGIDIGAKTEIYRLISQLAASGKSVIIVSSELPELIGMSDRVLVMCNGKMTGELPRQQLNEQAIMSYATNQAGAVGENASS